MSEEVVTLGGGCFWCLEAVFQELRGVTSVVSGYAGGAEPDPTYGDVCAGVTGHAEVVQVRFDPAVISLREILVVFFSIHDPTTLNRQGADVGTQYRSAIFYHNDYQKRIAEEYKQKLDKAEAFPAPIVTEITLASEFYSAEDYHQNYFNLNPRQGYCQMIVGPKVEKFKKVFPDKVKEE